MILIDKISAKGVQSVTTVTLQHNVSSQDAVLLVLSTGSTASTAAITWGGMPMKQLAQVSATNLVTISYLANPAVGTRDIVATWSAGTAGGDIVAFTLLGVDKKADPLTFTATGAAAPYSLSIVNPWAQGFVIDDVSIAASTANFFTTPGSGQTSVTFGDGPSSYLTNSSYRSLPNGTNTIVWNTSGSATVTASARAAVLLKPEDATSIWHPVVVDRDNTIPTTTDVDPGQFSFQKGPTPFFKDAFLHTIGRVKPVINNTFNLTVSDTITTTENVVTGGDLFVNKSDTITTTENIITGGDLFVNKSDTITTTENVNNSLVNTIVVSDVIRVSGRKNYVVNPNFETNDLYWGTGGGATKAQDATEFLFGTKSLKMVGAAVDDRVYITVGDGLTPVNGNSYTFSIWLKGSGTVRLWVYDGSVDQFSSNIVLSSTWTRYSLTITAQATSGLFAGVRQNAAGACTAYFDGAQLEDGTIATTFFDGTISGASWDGTAHNSTSTWNSDKANMALAYQINKSDTITLSESTSQFIVPPWRVIVSDPLAKTTIHVGSYSIDGHAWTQDQIEKAVNAIVINIPNANYIAIGTYMDYASQITLWANAVHNAGKRLWIRSAGFNDWNGNNSVAQYTSADFADHSTSQYVTWINTNFAIFRSGDIFEPVPDEPENNSMWNTTYGTIGSGSGKTAYNSFITSAITSINSALASNGVTGVTTTYVHTNPSAARDVITSATAAVLSAMGPDSYPEAVSDTTGVLCAAAMQTEFDTYMKGQQSGKPYHITFGPNVHVQLSEAEQADAFDREFLIFKNNGQTPIDGLTVWQEGASDNSALSRLFDITSGAWTARQAATNVNTMFGQMQGIFVQEQTIVRLDILPNKSDSITVTENVSLAVSAPQVVVSDSISVTDTPNIALASQINVSDTITVSDTVLMLLVSLLNISDSITVSENIVRVLESNVVTSDTITVTESIQRLLTSFIATSDSISLSENVSMMLESQVTVSDSITVTEAVTQRLTSFVSVSDSITTTDTPNIALAHQVNVSDSITVTENTVLAVVFSALQISVSDTITVTDTPNIALVHQINVSDSITVTENVKMLLESLVTISDSISVTDTPNMLLINMPAVSDSITVSENRILELNSFISVSDSITTTENILAFLTSLITVADNVTASENVNIALAHQITVSDSITVTENIVTLASNPQISVADTVNVFEPSRYAITLNGTTQYGTFTAPFTRTAGQPFAAIAWIRTSSNNTSHRDIVGVRSGSGGGDLWKLELNGNKAAFEYDPVGSGAAIAGTTDLNDGLAHCLIGVYNGTNTILYVDGIQVAISGSIPNAFIDQTNGAIGRQPDASTEFFIGDVGPIYIFNAALSGSDVTAYYNDGVLDLTNLQMGWQMSEGQGAILGDISTTNTKVTLQNSPTWTGGFGQAQQVPQLVSNISRSESITVTEAIALDNTRTFNVSDAVVVAENSIVELNSFINKNETITVTEAFNVLRVSDIAVSDTITVTESSSVVLPDALAITVSDSINLSEFTGVSQGYSAPVQDTITTSENVSLIVSDPKIATSDTVTVTEFFDPELESTITISDSITVTEARKVELTSNASGYDTISVSENTQVELNSDLSVADTITVNEAIVANLQITITVSDSISVSENTAITISDAQITVSDSISVNEAIKLELESQVQVSDAITVSEAIGIITPISLTTSSTISVSEQVNADPHFPITISDSITITENQAIKVSDPQITVSEAITVTEAMQFAFVHFLTASDSITVIDTPLLDTPRQPDPPPKIIMVEGKLAYLIVRTGIPQYIFI
jgi:hypothetical protein